MSVRDEHKKNKSIFLNHLLELNEEDFEKEVKSKNGFNYNPLKSITDKEYIYDIPYWRTIDEHILILTKFKRFITIKDLTKITKEIFNNLNNVRIKELQNKPQLLNWFIENTGLTRTLLIKMIFKRIEYLYRPEITEEIIENILSISKNKLNIHFFSTLHVKFILFLFESVRNDIIQEPFIEEFIIYLFYKLEDIVHFDKASFSAKKIKLQSTIINELINIYPLTNSQQDTLDKINLHFYKVEEHWINESIITKVFRWMTIYTYYDRYDHDKNLNLVFNELTDKQKCILQVIIDDLIKLFNEETSRTLRRESKNKIQPLYDAFVVSIIKLNIHVVKSKLFFPCYREDIIKEEIYSIDGDELWSNYNLSRQGLNELYEDERDEEQKYYKQHNITKEDNISPFYLSRYWCRASYRDYKKVCEKVKSCNSNLSNNENKSIRYLIHSCSKKIEMYRHACVHKPDEGHKQEIEKLEDMYIECGDILNST